MNWTTLGAVALGALLGWLPTLWQSRRDDNRRRREELVGVVVRFLATAEHYWLAARSVVAAKAERDSWVSQGATAEVLRLADERIEQAKRDRELTRREAAETLAHVRLFLPSLDARASQLVGLAAAVPLVEADLQQRVQERIALRTDFEGEARRLLDLGIKSRNLPRP